MIYGYIRLRMRKDMVEDVPKEEQYKGVALYGFVYGLGIFLAYTISAMIATQIEGDMSQWIVLILTLIVVIVVIIQILSKLLPERLRKALL